MPPLSAANDASACNGQKTLRPGIGGTFGGQRGDVGVRADSIDGEGNLSGHSAAPAPC
jgi:hypothetical protein